MRSVRQRPLGDTGINVSEIGLGCWGIGGRMRRDGTVSGYGKVETSETFGFLEREMNGSASQAALGCCLTQSSISTVIPGAMTVAIMEDNLAASSLDFQPGWIDQIERIQEQQLGEEL